MQITSRAFKHNHHIPSLYTCKETNINPPLEFSHIPQNSASLVLVVSDLDATPQLWIHWFVFNIPPATTKIEENTIPEGATEGYANGGTPGYEGPCPKYFSGTHHYSFMLYALDAPLNVNKTATFWDCEEFIKQHTLEKAELIGIQEGTGE